MADHSEIEWTESTWNPVTGCSKVSSGCRNCYAERMAARLQAMGSTSYRNGFSVTVHERMLNRPLTWKHPRMIFVNSMSDLFHEEISDLFVHSVFDVMRQASHHTFQILTKRSKRLARMAGEISWPNNVWMGVTVEDSSHLYRLDDLRKTDAAVKFLSAEPLLGPLPVNLDGIDWVIAGGESGPGARKMREEWVLDLRDRCITSNTSFFFKQWGGVWKKRAGRLLEGMIWNQFPSHPG